VDRHRFDADPEPAFCFYVDPALNTDPTLKLDEGKEQGINLNDGSKPLE
jgi:hypothetical protein